MTTQTRDIVVIGAGVAGAAFAAQVAHPSRRVLLVERSTWPRTKVCGCCLNAAAVATLERLNVHEALRTIAAPIDRVNLYARGRNAPLSTAPGLAFSRSTLDSLLVQRAAEAGVEFQPGVTATVTTQNLAGDWSVLLRSAEGDHIVNTSIVIAADGLCGSSLSDLDDFQPIVSPRAWFGLGGTLSNASTTACPPGAINMHIGTHGYAGLVRLDPQTINLAAAIDPAWTKQVGGPAQAIAAILHEGGGTSLDLTAVQFRGTGLLTRRRTRVSAPGLLVIGDAAGYVEPFTGEGMAWGLAGAEAAAGMVNAGLSGQSLANAWASWHTAQVRSRQRTCMLIRGLLRRPRLVGCVLSAMNTIPAAARVVAAVARRIERPYEQAAPSPQGAAA